MLTFLNKNIFMTIEGIGFKMAKLTRDVYSHGVLAGTHPKALLLYAHTTMGIPTAITPSWHWLRYLWFGIGL
jgi:hypothetical protein